MLKFKPTSAKSPSNKDAYTRELQTMLRLAGVKVDAAVHTPDSSSLDFVFRHGRLEYRIGAVPARGYNTVVRVAFVSVEVSSGEFSRVEPFGLDMPTKTGVGRNARKQLVDNSAIDESWMLGIDCRQSVVSAAHQLHAFMERMEVRFNDQIEQITAAALVKAGNKRVVDSVAGSLGLRKVHSWANEYRTPFDGLTLRMDEDTGLVSAIKFDLSIPAANIVEILPALAELVEAAARAAGATDEGV